MKCNIRSFAAPTELYGSNGTAKAVHHCIVHDWRFDSPITTAMSLCPIGRIEQATDDAIAKINRLLVADAIPTHQTDITASVFGGESDYNVSAYDETIVLNDTDLYVALPDRFEGERPLVRVVNRVTNATAIASIEDVGPWNTDDPYWQTCTRPAAESGTDEKGRTTNYAGIDLSPALAALLGVDGMGKVDWDFTDE